MEIKFIKVRATRSAFQSAVASGEFTGTRQVNDVTGNGGWFARAA